jgi:hypothetical protein
MAVYTCSAGCPRLISVSAVPGGNPAALADPEGFASAWTRCDHCSRFTCDRCLAKQGGQCACGQPSRLLSEPERIQVAVALMQKAAIPAFGTSRGAQATPNPSADESPEAHRQRLMLALGISSPTAPAQPAINTTTLLQHVGFFRELKHGSPTGPSLQESVRAKATPDAPYAVHYLRECAIFIAAMGSVRDVLDPASPRIGSPSIRTDGVWCWPSDLAHYLEKYNVELPRAFIEHGRTRNWEPVPESALDLRSLRMS